MSKLTTPLKLRVNAITFEAENILSFELVDPTGAELPPFSAGAHIEIDLPNGLSRSYSLTNPQGERHRYVTAVRNDRDGRGGSRYLHEKSRVGDVLQIRPPHNNFPLHEDAHETVLIAGGIGITPLWCMIQRLEQLDKNWRLLYCARTRKDMAFRKQLEVLQRSKPGRVIFNFDHEPGGKILDLPQTLEAVDPDTHLYCCGPPGMLLAFEQACAARPPKRVHLEYFTPRPFEGVASAFQIVIGKGGQSFEVAEEESILEVLLKNGFNPPFSCREGVCGTCEVRVLEGTPEHRDSVLSEQERASNKTMMICCSRSKTERLVIDL
jgi:ferredoxin-NADP reductase